MGTANFVLNELQSKFGMSGGSASTLLSTFLAYMEEQTAGLRGLLDRFKMAGLADSVSSWFGGAPEPITAENVESALGRNTVSNIASRAGLSAATTASALAFMLPKLVQRIAPGGQIPSQLPAEFSSYISHPTGVASRARDIVYGDERALGRPRSRNLLWPILGVLIALFFLVWFWNRSAARSARFVADQQVRLATQRAEATLGSLKPGFSAQDLVNALNLGVINFVPGTTDVPSSSYDFLNKAAVAIKAAPTGTVIQVGGHTDNSGDSAADLQLSQQRAEAVRTYLVNQGVDPAALTTQGFGSTKPLATNDTEQGRLRNRRIEFTVIH